MRKLQTRNWIIIDIRDLPTLLWPLRQTLRPLGADSETETTDTSRLRPPYFIIFHLRPYNPINWLSDT